MGYPAGYRPCFAWGSGEAHKLDERLSQIVAKSREGFIFTIELVVQIHVPDTSAPRVISMVGTIANLVNEVLQAAVGNHFRDKLQSMPAVEFIETRQQVQQAALAHIRSQLTQYEVETRGVYIQDVILPKELVLVLTQREIANQEKATYQMQQEAQRLRIDLEKTKGTADMQAQLAQAQVGVEIATQAAAARKRQADGEPRFPRGVIYVTVFGRRQRIFRGFRWWIVTSFLAGPSLSDTSGLLSPGLAWRCPMRFAAEFPGANACPLCLPCLPAGWDCTIFLLFPPKKGRDNLEGRSWMADSSFSIRSRRGNDATRPFAQSLSKAKR